MASLDFKLDLDTSALDHAQAKADKLKATLEEVKTLQRGTVAGVLTDDQIKHMVEQFLRWKLPETFNPDGGITFSPTYRNGTPQGGKHEPVGTNLLDYAQAKAMVEHMLDGLPDNT